MGRPYYVIGFQGQTPPDWLARHPHGWSRLGAVGKTMKLLHQNGAQDVVLAGAMVRPSLTSLFPDRRALLILRKLGRDALGDDRLLRAVMRELENGGFRVVGAHEVAPELLLPAGPLTSRPLTAQETSDIETGYQAAKTLGQLDIGQAVIVQQGRVIGVEGVEGTDGLIARCTPWTQKNGGVLVKTAKPQQDTRADLPALGPDTVQNAHAAGLTAIAGEAGKTLLLEGQEMAQKAENLKISIFGIDNGSPSL